MDSQINTNVLKTPSKTVVATFLKSTFAMQNVTEFMTIQQILALQLLNKDFYNRVIPNVMTVRKMFPNIDPKMHLFISNNSLWGIKIPSRSDAREVDFEEDEWIHENQYVLDENGHQWPEKLFDFKDIGAGEEDPELQIGAKEEVLIQNTF